MNRLKGAADLIADAVEETTNLVERMHVLVTKKTFRPLLLVEPLSTFAKAVKTSHDMTAGGVYETIRIVNKGIKNLLDAGAEFALSGAPISENRQQHRREPKKSSDAKGSPSWMIDHCQAVLNGLYGDFLGKQENELDMGMEFRHQGRMLAMKKKEIAQLIPGATGKVCIFIHGLMCTEWVWCISADRFYADPAINFGSLLMKDLGYTPLYVRYNTGRHVSENGRRLSTLLTQLISEYPCDIEEIILIGHSMGGLVARSAAHYGDKDDSVWIKKLRHVFCIGSPNLGAPLEKATNVFSSLLRRINTVGTQVPSEILNARSAGIKDLRFGYTIDEEWEGKDPDALLEDHRQNIPFVDGVAYSFIAATITQDPEHPMGVIFGDLMVRVPSAAGKAPKPDRRIPFRSGAVFGKMNHLHLANQPDVYSVIRQSLS